jgi:pimeloyl-ACP methyl ester carboxylesterase
MTLRAASPRTVAVMASCTLAIGWLCAASAPAADERGRPRCESVRVPVELPAIASPSLMGELCVPGERVPSTVQLLVHGGSYDHSYFDWPLDPAHYSYVQDALRAGYATFNVDRFGAGGSTHPPSDQVTLAGGAEALHQVIGKLRRGEIGGRRFARVVWVGHSFGSIYAWVEAERFGDVDAFVLTGMLHSLKPSFLERALASNYPASFDPKFAAAGLDHGYLTTVPGTRGELFYRLATADAAIVSLDEELKDTLTTTELAEGIPLFSDPPAETAPSRTIAVPTLVVVGEHDNLACGPPDGLTCTRRQVRVHEAPYYSNSARLQVQVVEDSGHSIQLHRTAKRSSTRILDWIDRVQTRWRR